MTQSCARFLRLPRVLQVLLPMLLVVCAAAPKMRAADLFTVSDVKVDATAKNAADAREEAIAEGQRKAFERLMARMVVTEGGGSLPHPDSSTIANLVRDFQINSEKASSVRYLATLTFRFRPDAVRDFLRSRQVDFAETMSAPVVVLPVFDSDSGVVLWQDTNPWRQAWLALPPSGGLVPLIEPIGDLADSAAISAQQAVDGNAGALKAIASRYHTADVLVTRADLRTGVEGSGPTVLRVVTMRYGPAADAEPRIETFTAKEDESTAALMARAATAVAAGIEQAWKRSNALHFGAANRMTVDVPVRSLDEWMKLRNGLEEVAMIRDRDLIYLSPAGARMRIEFLGTEDQLRRALAQNDMSLEQGPSGPVLRLGEGGNVAPGQSASGKPGLPGNAFDNMPGSIAAP